MIKSETGLIATTARRLDAATYFVVWCAPVLLFITFAFGLHVAYNEIEFMVPQGPECVVAQIRTEGWLCVAFDAKSHALLPKYHIIKPTDQELTFQRLGHLRAALPLSSSLTDSPAKHSPSAGAHPGSTTVPPSPASLVGTTSCKPVPPCKAFGGGDRGSLFPSFGWW